MKICPSCGGKFSDHEWKCPSCFFSPQKLDGCISFASEKAKGSEGFQLTHFPKLAQAEAGNFWFRSRNELIIWALQHYFPVAGNFFEIGCGTGFVLSGIKRSCPNLSICGSEIYSTGLRFAKERLGNVELYQMDARRIPFVDEFDVIGAFDVLEHIAEDELVLQEIHKSIKPGGGLLLTVPQHQFLWSSTDESACHVRRYEAFEVKEKLRNAGFSLMRVTSFVSLLFPLMLASRLWQKNSQGAVNELDELQMSEWANMALEKVLDFERWFIRRGLNFPVGGSLLVVAKKI